MMHDDKKALETAAGTVAFKFNGRAGEYFAIWIVNLCLSVLTLGIYSAWAKVRRKRYFYGNTLLNDSAFEYLANPVAILRGRLIVVAAFVLYSVGNQFNPMVGAAVTLAFVIAVPWVVVKAMRFNARNTAHRNVRFGFAGSYGGWLGRVGLPALLAFITLGLAFPYFLYCKDKYVVEQHAYGVARFAFHGTAGAYYWASFKVFLVGLGFLAGTIVTLGIGAIPLYILARSYAVATMGRVRWNNTVLGEIRFACGWTTGGLFGLYFVNLLAAIGSFGLLAPWTAIRSARYHLENLSLAPALAIGSFVAANQEQVSALGDELGEMVGFDFGL
jgi:uncharacterized membrane protein YjgN (DUF898 family)